MNEIFKRRVQQAAQANQQLRQSAKEHQEEMFQAYYERMRQKYAPIEVDYGIPAIRGWYLENNKLISLAVRTKEWEGPVIEDDANPTFFNPRGFWAIKPHRLDWLVRTYRPDVIGWVELQGKVVEHTEGWRAEVCVIRTLYLIVPTFVLGSKRALEDRYQCDVHYGLKEYYEHR